MGLFSKDKNKKEEKIEEEQEEDEEDNSGECSLNIYTIEESGNIQMEELTEEQLKDLKKDIERAIADKSSLNLEKYNFNQVINGNYIVSFDWQE